MAKLIFKTTLRAKKQIQHNFEQKNLLSISGVKKFV